MAYEEKNDQIRQLCSDGLKRFLIQVNEPSGLLPIFTMYLSFMWEDAFYISDDYKFHTIKDYLSGPVKDHKVAVYEAGISLIKKLDFKELGVDEQMFRERLIFHDLSKYSTREHGGYAFRDFQAKRDTFPVQFRFEGAWHHHKVSNSHHPEYWWSVNRQGMGKFIDMPMIDIVEMIADWMGAGKTYGSSLEAWLPGNLHTFNFSEKTGSHVLMVLEMLGINFEKV